MKRKRMHGILLGALLPIVALNTPQPGGAQDAKEPYPSMAPVKQYLMDRDAEIALARSAAPDAISHDATIVVLGRHGYETAVEGKNGWVCMVGRAWGAMFDHPEFWNPKSSSRELRESAGSAVRAASRVQAHGIAAGWPF